MRLIPWVMIFALAAGPAATLAQAAPKKEHPLDPIALILADADYEARRTELQQALKGAGSPCRTLPAYAANANEAVREHAVRALDDAGCASLDAYRSFFRDRAAWVVDAVIRALRRHRVTEGVPFLLDRLSDQRRILSDEGSWALWESAHAALRAITCRSFHYDPRDRPQARAAAVDRWKSWYEEHRDEPREAWVASGIAQARSYLDDPRPRIRREGFDLLAAIGAPASAALRAALDRRPQDIKVTASCLPDEPPRVTEEVPCVLEVANVSSRRVALAIGSLEVAVQRRDPAAAGDEPGGHPKNPSPTRRGRGTAPTTATAPSADADSKSGDGSSQGHAVTEDLARLIVDLAPGESLKREFKIGPVFTAGRYEVRAALPDLSSALQGPETRPRTTADAPSLIEGRTVVHFEQ